MRTRNGEILALLAPLALYLASCYYDVTYWDVGEMDTVPWILGIAHPPAMPAFVLIGWAFSHAIAVGSVAFRMSLLSAIAVSVASWCVFRAIVDEYRDPVAGLCASLTFATGLVVWTRATRAEAHAVETAVIALVLLLLLRWYRTAQRRDLFGAAACYGIAVAVHPVALLAAPGLVLILIARMHEAEPRDVGLALAIATLCTAVWFVYLPARSAYVSASDLDPAGAIGMPGGAFWNYGSPSTPAGLLALVTGANVDVPRAFAAAYDFDVVKAGIAHAAAIYAREFAYAGLGVVALGWALVARRDPSLALGMAAIAIAGPSFTFGFRDESDVSRYFMTSFFVSALALGAAVAFARQRGGLASRFSGIAVAAIVAASLVDGSVLFGQPHDTRARAEVSSVLASTPDRAILIATWVLAPPLAYATYVERSAGNRTVVPAWYGDSENRLAGWMKQRPVYVVGSPMGSVEGFRLKRVAASTELYAVVAK